MIHPEELRDLNDTDQRKVSDVLVQENQLSSYDAEDHYGELTKDGRQFHWETKDDAENSLQDYLDQL